MSFAARTEQLLDAFRQRRPVRTNSLLMTIYGDSLEPHGGTLWLGSLIRLVEPLGISQRLVRTSVFRLTREDWLIAKPRGRRSYYRLTERGRRQFGTAELRIYNDPPQAWDGTWRMAFVSSGELAAAQRDAIRRELAWQGFGMIAPDVFAHPTAALGPVEEMFEEKGLSERVILMRGEQLDSTDRCATEEMVRRCWKLDAIEADYRAFIASFAPLLDAAGDDDDLAPRECFLLRSLLIHEFRRVLLRDAQLPASLLPRGWAGQRARDLTRNLYGIVQARAEDHLMAHCETEHGGLPPANTEYARRFGGLCDNLTVEARHSGSASPAP